jgi:hypothetical protein
MDQRGDAGMANLPQKSSFPFGCPASRPPVQALFALAFCTFLSFMAAAAIAQNSVPFPSTSAPPSFSTTPPTYPTTTSPYNPYAPTFRDSTAPMATGIPPGSIPVGSYPMGTVPMGTVPMGTVPMGTYPMGAMPMGAMPTSAVPTGAFPTSVYPNTQPPVLYPGTPYPGTQFVAQPNWWTATTVAVQTQTQETIRLCQGFRFRYTYLPGNGDFSALGPNDLESNDFDFSLVFACPKFLGCSQPLYIIPSYTQSLWSGPSAPGTNLPGAAFAGFVDLTWETDPMQTWGAELGARLGVFSAFDAVNSNSFRYPLKALGRVRCTPNSTARAGVYYLDRVKVKLMPAVGILWVPNPDTRWDIFFPEPKLSHYLTTHGDKDVWCYLTAYYGGGSWTIEQPDGSDDEVDINDVRIMLGFECGKSELIRQGFRSYFFEIGYAVNRELVYRYNPQDDLDLADSLVFRAGFGY